MTSTLRRALLGVALATLPLMTAWAAQPAGADLRVGDAWARATPPGAAVAAVYLAIHGGTEPDRLVSVSTARASMAQIHSVTTAAGVSRMRELTDGVAIPAGKTLTLAPQGLHIMLMGLESPLAAGEHFALTLDFATAGKREVSVTVLPATATGPVPH